MCTGTIFSHCITLLANRYYCCHIITTYFVTHVMQICLWTGVGFVLLLIASVGSLSNMEVIPDSLLYAKFQSARTGRSD